MCKPISQEVPAADHTAMSRTWLPSLDLTDIELVTEGEFRATVAPAQGTRVTAWWNPRNPSDAGVETTDAHHPLGLFPPDIAALLYHEYFLNGACPEFVVRSAEAYSDGGVSVRVMAVPACCAEEPLPDRIMQTALPKRVKKTAGQPDWFADGIAVTLEPHPSHSPAPAPSVGDKVVLRKSRSFGRVVAYVSGKPVGVLPSELGEALAAEYLCNGQIVWCWVSKLYVVKYVGTRIQVKIAGVIASDPQSQALQARAACAHKGVGSNAL